MLLAAVWTFLISWRRKHPLHPQRILLELLLIYFDPSRGGATLLCTGSRASAADVIDVVAFSEGEPHPPLSAGVTFLPGGLSGGSQVFSRTAFDGYSPTIKLADWTV